MEKFVSMPRGFVFAADVIGLAALTWLLWRVMFQSGEEFQAAAILVGIIGIAARLIDRRGGGPGIPIALVVFAAIGLASAAGHPSGSADAVEWWRRFEPALHLAVMAAYVIGVAHLLRTRQRLAVISVLLTAAALALAAQTIFDYAISGYDGQPTLQTMLPTVAQWKGVHDLTFALSAGVPLALAPGLVSRRAWMIVAGLAIAAVPIAASYSISSRGGTASMIAIAGTMTVAAIGGPRLVRAGAVTLSALLGLFLVAGIAVAIFGWGNLESVRTVGGRAGIWAGATTLIATHPWLGVGPGNFRTAMMNAGLDPIGHLNAHNLLLHVMAEMGIAAGIALALFIIMTMRGNWRAWQSGRGGAAPAGLFFVVLLLVVRWSADTFIEGSFVQARHRVFAWTLLAAAVAAARLGQLDAALPKVGDAA
jgi:putative inorganic carbon (hco3(-)) transporter